MASHAESTEGRKHAKDYSGPIHLEPHPSNENPTKTTGHYDSTAMTDDTISTPFTEDMELFHGLKAIVPGQPLISLDDKDSVMNFLSSELSTERLGKMYFMLFLVSNRRNISPLHHQALKGRKILITERPDLHLVWYYDHIFIKPIPLCLLNHGFYQTYILSSSVSSAPDSQLFREANGFLRTYADLIVHESDFDLAKSIKLLPDITWENWCYFIQNIKYLSDSEVSARYHYGELRLTRLNFYSKLFLFGWSYFEVYHQYVAYFVRFIALYAFIFGAISVILSAMQTALTADPNGPYKSSAYGFATTSIAFTGAGLAFFPMLYLFFQMRELFLYIFHHHKPRELCHRIIIQAKFFSWSRTPKLAIPGEGLALCPFLLVLHLLSEAKRLTRSWNVDIENPQIEAAPPLMTPCSLRLCPPGFFDYATNDIILFLFAMCDNMLVCLALNDSQDLMSTVETNHELPNPINVIWRRSHRARKTSHKPIAF